MHFNIPTFIVDFKTFKRPEVMATYLLVYERAATVKKYTHNGKKVSLEVDEGVCTRSYVSRHLGFTESLAKSHLATLVRLGLLDKITKEEIKEDVYRVPAISSSEEEFARLEIKEKIEKIYQKGKYLLTTLMYLAVDAKQENSTSLSTTYDRICRFVGCTRDIARTAMAKLRELRLVVFEGARRLGLCIKEIAIKSFKKTVEKTSEIVSEAVRDVKETVKKTIDENRLNEPQVPYSGIILNYLNKRKIKVNDKQKITELIINLSRMLAAGDFDEDVVRTALENYVIDHSEKYPVASHIFKYVCEFRKRKIALEEQERAAKAERAAKNADDMAKNRILEICAKFEEIVEEADGKLLAHLSDAQAKEIYINLAPYLGFLAGCFSNEKNKSAQIIKYLGNFRSKAELHAALIKKWPRYANFNKAQY